MSESEKLQQTIGGFETEVATLETDIATLEQQLITATTTAETAIATAERRADKASQAAAVDAEQERQRLATSLTRKRLALQAATADLQTARHGLTASQRGADLVELATLIDGVAASAAAVDDEPLSPAAWATLRVQIDQSQSHFRRAGGQGLLFGADLVAMHKGVMSAYTLVTSLAVKPTPTGGNGVEIPRLVEMLRIPRAHARVRELGSN